MVRVALLFMQPLGMMMTCLGSWQLRCQVSLTVRLPLLPIMTMVEWSLVPPLVLAVATTLVLHLVLGLALRAVPI